MLFTDITLQEIMQLRYITVTIQYNHIYTDFVSYEI